MVFERGDTQAFYDDATVRATLNLLSYAIVFAHECDAQTTGDFQAAASKGPARTLFTALSELGITSLHPELATGSVVLFGYSAAGVLTATMLNEEPSRISGAVEYLPGDVHLDIAQVPAGTGALKIPALILANALDQKSGTTRILTYFQNAHTAGAPWAFGVQRATDHCCSLSSRPLVLPWLSSIAAAHAAPPLGAVAAFSPSYSTFICVANRTVDIFGNSNCEIKNAEVQGSAPAAGLYNWFPDVVTAVAWTSWVQSPTTNQ